jgi:hypothetical protein
VTLAIEKELMMVSFEDYVQMDPRIGELLKEAQAIKAIPGERFCANRIW